MTIQQHASFDSSAAELNATSKLVKAWESKNAKNAAKAGGVSLMALSLAACGGSSSDEVTVISATAADAGLTDSSATTAAELVLEIKTSDNTDVMLTQGEFDAAKVEAILNAVTSVDAGALSVQDVADLAFGEGVASEAQAIVDEINTLLGTNFTTDDEADTVIGAIVSSDNAELVKATLTANGITYESLEVALASIDPTVNDSGVAADAKSEALTSEAGDEFVSVDEAIISNDADIKTAALTDADGTVYGDVDEAIISNDADIKTAALTDAGGTVYGDVDEAYDTGVQDGKDSRDTEVQGLTDTITAIDNTAFDDEQAAYDAGEESRDTEVQGLENQVQDLENQIAAFQDVANRELNDDNETIDLTSSTSNTIIVLGEGAGADSLDGTVLTASGAVVFDFTDAADTVVLSAASDLTGVTDIDIQGGTVDFTALGGGVNTLAGVNITAASGSLMTGSQFLAFGTVGGANHQLVLVLEAGNDVDAILTKLQSADVNFAQLKVMAPDNLLTPTQKTALESLANTTVTDLVGEAVDTTNEAPTIATAETTTLAGGNDAQAFTATAVVSDTEANWNGGSISLTPESGILIGEAGSNAEGLTIANTNNIAGGGQYDYATVNDGTNINITATDAGGTTMIVGTVVNNGLAVNGGSGFNTYTSVQVNLNSNATTAIVNDLTGNMQFDGVVDTTDGTVDEGDVTMTVTDAAGDSASFARTVDSDGDTALTDFADSREIEVAIIQAGMTIDDGGVAANLVNNGLDLDGATMTFASSVAGDTINAIANGYTIVNTGHLNDGTTIIGTITGNASNSVEIVFNSTADAANVASLLQTTEVTGSDLGAHVITTKITESSGDTSVTEANTLTVVGDFGGATGASTGGTKGSPIELAEILAVTDPANVITLTGNTYINIGTDDYSATAAQDIKAQIEAGHLVTNATYIRLVTDGDSTTFDEVTSLSALGTNIVWYDIGNSLEMNAAQASGSTIAVTGTATVTDLFDNTAADLSGVTGTVAVNSTATMTEDTTFTGTLGTSTLVVDGAFALTMDADEAGGKTITHFENDAAADIILTGVDANFTGDLGGVTISAGAGTVNVAIDSDTTLDAAAQIDSADLVATVAADATLTLSASQATAIAVSGGAVAGGAASGALGSVGGSMVVTVSDMDSDGSTDAVELEDLDLSALTAGVVAAGGYAGTSVMVIDQDVEMTGTLTAGTTTISVASGSTITDNGGVAATLTGAAIAGAGNIVIADIGLDANADLSTLTNTGTQTANVGTDATFTGDFGTFDVVVAENVTLTADVDVVSGLTVAGAATTVDTVADTGGIIALTGLDAAAFDLSNITGGAASEASDTAGTVTVTGDISGGVLLHADTDLGNAAVALDDVALGLAALTLTAAQATGRVITDGANESLVITGLAGDTDLSGITLSGSGGITINMADGGAADVSGNANFLAADAGDTALAIALTDSTLTATAEQLDGATVAGADGSDSDSDNDSVVVLTGGVAAVTGGNTAYDITGLDDTSVDFTIAAGYTVSNFTEVDGTVRTATLTADAVHLAGQSVSGTGVVVGAAFDATAAGDFSGLTATTTQLQLAADAVLSSSVTLGTATIVLDSDAAGASSSDDSLSVTTSQASGLNVADGGGNGTSNVTITGAVTADVVDYSSTDWDVDTLTLNMLSGDNNITGAQNVGSNIITTSSGNDSITTGTDADVITGGLGNDLFEINHGDDTNAVTIMDFTSGTDYIDLDTAVGQYAEAADADLDSDADGNGDGGDDAATIMAAAVAAAETAITGDFVAGNYYFVGDTDAQDANAEVKGFLMADTDGDDSIDLVIILDGLGAADIAVTDII
ncbi:hypothetical protein OAI05_01020 [Planktomarina temperata]|nr:hypothetical protein [Planktomarina temperata]